MKVTFDSITIPGEYKWIDKDNIEVSVTGTDMKKLTEKTKVVVTKRFAVV